MNSMQSNDLTQAAQRARENRKQEKEKARAQEDSELQFDLLEETRDTTLIGFRALIEHLAANVAKTEVTNQPDSISTPDVAQVVSAVRKLEKTTKDKEVDFKPLLEAVNGLSRKIDRLPKAFPELPQPKDEVQVTNLGELTSKIEALSTDIKKIELKPTFQPKIEVKAPKVTVPKTEVKVDTKELAESIDVLSNKLDMVMLTMPQSNGEALIEWLEKIDKRLEWIGTRPIPMGTTGQAGGTSTVSNVYDTGVYDTASYS